MRPNNRFVDRSLEVLYQHYRIKQKRESLPCYILAVMLFNVLTLIVHHQDEDNSLYVTFFGVSFLMFVWSIMPKKIYTPMIPIVSIALMNSQLYAHQQVYLPSTRTPNENLGWMILFMYLQFVTMPATSISGLIFNLIGFTIYILNQNKHIDPAIERYGRTMFANCFILIAANVLGVLAYYIVDKQQRIAFQETRQRLTVKVSIEEESAEQERLLLSVLPEHVAVKMRQDLGSVLDTQFKKIYMSRHENVSILYADIVGFTAISSTYSAAELVKILNELFARFDRLSEKHYQLRIKILGDCYYCISGAPQERPDHAILSVHMGLSMVQAIKYVQQTTNSPVDMRVGIHTGAVLAGVLGQRQWQFDVYSKDVELANKMESSGLPGRVHVSEKTLSFLNDEFEVEPAFGEDREECLKLAGIKTFFIVKALKPYKEPNSKEAPNGLLAAEEASYGKEESELASSMLEDLDSCDIKLTREEMFFKVRLKRELMNRNRYADLMKQTYPICMKFKDKNKEKIYQDQIESSSYFSTIACPIALISAILSIFVYMEKELEPPIMAYEIIIILIGILMGYANIHIDPLQSAEPRLIGRCAAMNAVCKIVVYLISIAMSISYIFIVGPVTAVNDPTLLGYNHDCFILILIAISLITQWSYIDRFVIMLMITISLIMLNCLTATELSEAFLMTIKEKAFLLICSAICLTMIGRQMEKSSRMLFLWKAEVEDQKEKASDIVRRNEALVYNILPKHVATHFLGNRKRQYDELYSQSYSEVGVLFASMPNFADFYSEESVNNQGLECLRFLNEVISDFDALLELPKFQDIIKIKTIGSTYMAASGLNPTRTIQQDDAIQVRWAHLDLLVEFALELKKALQSINEQSFNHFALQMGINHGPIIAGVIGARKPHYDIWGNSVNVASRMESTGKAGYIQVTEETCKILLHFGYEFEQRGLVPVKGKGQLMTYYLLGKKKSPSSSTETVRQDDHLNIPPVKNSDIKIEINQETVRQEDHLNIPPVGDSDIKIEINQETSVLNEDKPKNFSPA